MPPDTVPYLPIFFGLSLLWWAAGVLASVLYRRSRGKPIIFRKVTNAEFVENAASGHSNRTWFTKLGGARNCLVVAVSGRRLIIRPRFPLNLMFLPEVYGLEHDVPLDRVTRVVVGPDGPGSVRLEFRESDDTLQDVTLYLRNPVKFVDAVGRSVT